MGRAGLLSRPDWSLMSSLGFVRRVIEALSAYRQRVRRSREELSSEFGERPLPPLPPLRRRDSDRR